ncbi:PIN domain-containing protein [Pyrobaculum sp.]|uniref:PIN domain-containing protein n=1 Tax=Pyrobaculum sp. TaxID=2004705 RepID=UPI003178F0F2
MTRGVVLGILDGELADVEREIVSGRLIPYISAVNLAEVEYVLRRRAGAEAASRAVDLLTKSRVFKVVDRLELHRAAAKCKCKNAVAIGDCYAIALACLLGVKAYFRREVELERVVKRNRELEEVVYFI